MTLLGEALKQYEPAETSFGVQVTMKWLAIAGTVLAIGFAIKGRTIWIVNDRHKNEWIECEDKKLT